MEKPNHGEGLSRLRRTATRARTRGATASSDDGFWTKDRDVPGAAAVEAAYDAFGLLRRLHRPTASALVLGAAGGAYLAWRLTHPHGILALVVGLLVGFVLGAFVGVVAYWMIKVLAHVLADLVD